jgi:toxin-antitoxin system PIN domain toxin
MSYLVDTNVLVYGSDQDSPYHTPAERFMERCARSPEAWYLTWVNIFEFLRVVTHPNVFKRPMPLADAQDNIGQLLSLPQVEVLTEETGFFDLYRDLTAQAGTVSGNLVHDSHIAALMLQHGVKRIYTLDTQFRLFPFLEVVNPLQP